MYLSPSLVPEPGRFESSGNVSGVGWASFGSLRSRVAAFGRRHLWGDSVAWSRVPGRVVVPWLQWSACWSRGTRGRCCRMSLYGGMSAAFSCFGDSEEDVGVYVHFAAGLSSVFRGSCLFDLRAPWL